mmetsp:Transcript_21075/g.46325  ORF Transcript_21075/g.46325 Transcript_21075/m.46325 type:complete len:227 (-) Transcript_21075:241-921(-)
MAPAVMVCPRRVKVVAEATSIVKVPARGLPPDPVMTTTSSSWSPWAASVVTVTGPEPVPPSSAATAAAMVFLWLIVTPVLPAKKSATSAPAVVAPRCSTVELCLVAVLSPLRAVHAALAMPCTVMASPVWNGWGALVASTVLVADSASTTVTGAHVSAMVSTQVSQSSLGKRSAPVVGFITSFGDRRWAAVPVPIIRKPRGLSLCMMYPPQMRSLSSYSVVQACLI